MDTVNINYDAARFWMDLLQLGAIVILGIYTHLTSRSKANREAINVLRQDLEGDADALEIRVARVESRIDVMDNKIESAPGHEDIGKVYERLNSVSGDVKQMNGQMNALVHQLTLINEYLLREKGGK